MDHRYPEEFRFRISESNSEHAIRIDSEDNKKPPKFSLDESTIINIIHNVPTYEGDYVVVPHTEDDIVLETKQKMMTSDVTVKKIPYFETSNVSGVTVYIGSEA